MKRSERLERRLKHLDALEEGAGAAFVPATKALESWVSQGEAVEAVRVRQAFIQRSSSVPAKPPASLLINGRGHALRTALISLFLAQTGKGGTRHLLKLPLRARAEDQVAWTDLIVSRATDGEGSYSRRVPDKRAASARQAIDRLARPDISFMELTSRDRVGRYDNVRLLQESGPRAIGAPLAYSVPGAGFLEIPAAFFLKGWIFVLEDSEIATYLMYRRLCAGGTIARITTADRDAWFGLSTSAWEQHWVLVQSGLLHLEEDPNRRPDGTVVDKAEGAPLLNHRFSLLDDGLKENALSRVWGAIDARSAAS